MPALSRLADTPNVTGRLLKIVEKVAMLTMPAVVFTIATSDWLILLLLVFNGETPRLCYATWDRRHRSAFAKTRDLVLVLKAVRAVAALGRGGLDIAVVSIVAVAMGRNRSRSVVRYNEMCEALREFWYIGRKGPVGLATCL